MNPGGLCGICQPNRPAVGEARLSSLAVQADRLYGPEEPDAEEPDASVEGGEPARRTMFRIPDENLADLQSRIAKYQAKAFKLGVPAPEIEVLSSEWVDDTLDDGTPSGKVRLVHEVRVAGESPHFNGWKLRAVIDFDHEEPDQPNVVHAIDDAADPAWRRMGNTCEHCDSARRRNKVVVVEHDSGERKVVGTTCLRDFLGSTSPESIASWAEMLSSFDDVAESYEDREPGGHYEQRFRADNYLAWVVRAVKTSGWRSRSDERGSTADLARTLMEDHAKGRSRGRWGSSEPPPEPLSDAEIAEAEAALEWARAIPEDVSNDYLANVRAVAGKEGWRWRDLGIGASIVVAKARAEGRERDTNTRRERALAAGYLGTPNAKVSFVGTVTRHLVVDGEWGPKTLVAIESRDGHSVVWWTTAATKPEVGAAYAFRATVKRHEPYDGLPQTTILRAKFEPVSETPGEPNEEATAVVVAV